MNKAKTSIGKAGVSVGHNRSGVTTPAGKESGLSIIERMAAMLESGVQLLRYVSLKGFIVTGMLLLIVVLSAVGVVYSSHLSRQLFAEQAILSEKNDQLQLEWAQLLLEQSAWSSPNRIEAVARDELGMEVPKTEDIKLIY